MDPIRRLEEKRENLLTQTKQNRLLVQRKQEDLDREIQRIESRAKSEIDRINRTIDRDENEIDRLLREITRLRDAADRERNKQRTSW